MAFISTPVSFENDFSISEIITVSDLIVSDFDANFINQLNPYRYFRYSPSFDEIDLYNNNPDIIGTDSFTVEGDPRDYVNTRLKWETNTLQTNVLMQTIIKLAWILIRVNIKLGPNTKLSEKGIMLDALYNIVSGVSRFTPPEDTQPGTYFDLFQCFSEINYNSNTLRINLTSANSITWRRVSVDNPKILYDPYISVALKLRGIIFTIARFTSLSVTQADSVSHYVNTGWGLLTNNPLSSDMGSLKLLMQDESQFPIPGNYNYSPLSSAVQYRNIMTYNQAVSADTYYFDEDDGFTIESLILKLYNFLFNEEVEDYLSPPLMKKQPSEAIFQQYTFKHNWLDDKISRFKIYFNSINGFQAYTLASPVESLVGFVKLCGIKSKAGTTDGISFIQNTIIDNSIPLSVNISVRNESLTSVNFYNIVVLTDTVSIQPIDSIAYNPYTRVEQPSSTTQTVCNSFYNEMVKSLSTVNSFAVELDPSYDWSNHNSSTLDQSTLKLLDETYFDVGEVLSGFTQLNQLLGYIISPGFNSTVTPTSVQLNGITYSIEDALNYLPDPTINGFQVMKIKLDFSPDGYTNTFETAMDVIVEVLRILSIVLGKLLLIAFNVALDLLKTTIDAFINVSIDLFNFILIPTRKYDILFKPSNYPFDSPGIQFDPPQSIIDLLSFREVDFVVIGESVMVVRDHERYYFLIIGNSRTVTSSDGYFTFISPVDTDEYLINVGLNLYNFYLRAELDPTPLHDVPPDSSFEQSDTRYLEMSIFGSLLPTKYGSLAGAALLTGSIVGVWLSNLGKIKNFYELFGTSEQILADNIGSYIQNVIASATNNNLSTYRSLPKYGSLDIRYSYTGTKEIVYKAEITLSLSSSYFVKFIMKWGISWLIKKLVEEKRADRLVNDEVINKTSKNIDQSTEIITDAIDNSSEIIIDGVEVWKPDYVGN